ncbi:MAG: methyltransferase domain-containing protein [Myxococcales bacterium]|nr:methyltransferase domain-containing protein [Myxococcales bacterium]
METGHAGGDRVTRQSGAVRIFLYNWPIYMGTWIVAIGLLVSLLVCLPLLPTVLAWLALLGAGVALAWSSFSLIVSGYIYDRSRLVSGEWIPELLAWRMDAWATIHAGLDAELELDRVMAGRCVARLDVFDPAVMSAPSIRRARLRTPAQKEALPCSPTALALADQTCDAIIVAFTAHEIRDRAARERFFEELRRSLRPGGRLLLVEHLRDFANFLAFGPGYLHFVAKSEWLRLASHAKLVVASETRITPWVMALTLERPL